MLVLPNMPVLCVGVFWCPATGSLHMLSVGSLSCYVTTFMQLNLLTPLCPLCFGLSSLSHIESSQQILSCITPQILMLGKHAFMISLMHLMEDENIEK